MKGGQVCKVHHGCRRGFRWDSLFTAFNEAGDRRGELIKASNKLMAYPFIRPRPSSSAGQKYHALGKPS